MSFTKELLHRCKDEGDRAKILTIFQNSLEARSYKVREAAALEVGAVADHSGRRGVSAPAAGAVRGAAEGQQQRGEEERDQPDDAAAKCLAKESFLQKLYQFLPSLATDANHEIAWALRAAREA